MSATLVWSEWRLTSVLIWDCLNLIFVCFRRHTVVWKMHYLIRMCCTWRAFRKSALHQSRSTSRWLKNIFIWYFCFLLSFLALKGTKLCCFILFPPAVGYSIPSCSGVQHSLLQWGTATDAETEVPSAENPTARTSGRRIAWTLYELREYTMARVSVTFKMWWWKIHNVS